MPVLRASFLLGMLAAAAAVAAALFRPDPTGTPPGIETAARDAREAPADDPVAVRGPEPERVAVPLAEPAADCRLRGRFLVPADVEPDSASWWVDGAPGRLYRANQYTFDSRWLTPGVHRLGAVWRAPGPRVEVVVRDVELGPGQDLDLGALAPAATAAARLRIVPRQLPSRTTFSAQEIEDAGLLGPVGLWITGNLQEHPIGFVSVPIGADIAVHGVPGSGFFVRVGGGPDRRGPPPTIRLGDLELCLAVGSDPQRLVPGAWLDLTLGYLLRCELALHVACPSGGAGWIELHVIDLPSGESVWQRWATAEGATRNVMLLAGGKLLVASLVDRDGVTRAFAQQRVALGAPRQVAGLLLERALPARGTWVAADPGQRIRIALAEWPQHPLWRAIAGAAGSFTIAGLPADQEFVAVDGQRVLPVETHREEDELVLRVAGR